MDSSLITQHNTTLEVCFNRPAKLNALTAGVLNGLGATVQRFASDDSLRVLLIRAEGRYLGRACGRDVERIANSLLFTGAEHNARVHSGTRDA